MGDKEREIHIYYTGGQKVLIKGSLVNTVLGGGVLQEEPAEDCSVPLVYRRLFLSVLLPFCFQAP